MNKKLAKLGLILLVFLVFLILIRTYLKEVYFPNHPTIYTVYQQRSDDNPDLDGIEVELLEPPVGGCFNNCWGTETVNSCEKYSRKYDKCEVSCNGYVYNNCTSSKLAIIVGWLTR